MRKFYFPSASVIVSVAAFAGAPASADTLQTYYQQSIQFGLVTGGHSGPGTFTDLGMTLSGGPDASGAKVTANGSVVFESPQADLIAVSGMGIQFQFVDPNYASQFGTYVPVVITGSYVTSGSGTGSGSAVIGINNSYFDGMSGSTAFALSASLFFNPNNSNINYLDVNATLYFSGAAGQGSAFAMVDPLVSIDNSSGKYSDYSVLFAPDALPTGATPLPAALPLFASGLAGLGWLARRRRKQPAA